MSSDLLLPLVTSAAWLVLVGSALASHRLGWGQMLKMALVWVAIFLGLYVIVEWFMVVQGTTSNLI
ncbi:hypothetical protein CHX26_11090 [Porphyrobacter sp. HT-58-2]|uniref:hypothetical protein n=1 Tax=Porphyrobacter sp. HT-58-2 TaxID=2023229 RepID=UPI000CDC7227|nr:hypothetical protein [Porphyrobacter sp. HT-58-2]AUX69960.1 hypothetical protein CHX26_11090 [Porphyrobacter sp. HT-58-2]